MITLLAIALLISSALLAFHLANSIFVPKTIVVDVPEEICEYALQWHKNILGMYEGREKWLELKKYNEYVLSLGEEKVSQSKVVNLSNYR